LTEAFKADMLQTLNYLFYEGYMDKENNAIKLASYFQHLKMWLYRTGKFASATNENINVQEVLTLLSLGAQGLMTMSEIAKTLQLSLSSVTNIVDKLERKDLVRRDRSSEDRRIIRVELTEAGAKYHVHVEGSYLQLMSYMLDVLDSEEQEQLLRLFHKITTGRRLDRIE